MYSRWFSYAVVLLWLTAMTWLVVEKVLPPLLVGEPPSYGAILARQKREPPVGWAMQFQGRPLGWALSTTKRLPDQVVEIRSHVHFNELPLDDLAPPWIRALLKVAKRPLIRLQMDAQSTLLVDPLDGLERFESALRLDPLEDPITLRGTIDGTQLKLVVCSGGLSYETTAYLPSDALLGDALSPQTQLPGLRKGQTWTVPAYSPLRPPNNPLEILQAKVERIEFITWDGGKEETWLVVYRRDPGFVLSRNRTPRGKLWVRRDGTVLQQEVMILNSAVTFVRLSDDEAVALGESIGLAEMEERMSNQRAAMSEQQ